jgi:hypothetical protein
MNRILGDDETDKKRAVNFKNNACRRHSRPRRNGGFGTSPFAYRKTIVLNVIGKAASGWGLAR